MALPGRLEEDLERQDPFWPAQLAGLAAILLYMALPDSLTIGPSWLLPLPETALLVALFIATPRREQRGTSLRRRLALGLIAVTAVATIVALVLLGKYLVAGGPDVGRPLLGAGVVLWGTIVLISALGYWEMDRGGPVVRNDSGGSVDFLFMQMTDDARPHVRGGWMPAFVDYLYLALTNATAFSPTDTMPLSTRAKLVMGVQGLVSAATLGLVVARAINILG